MTRNLEDCVDRALAARQALIDDEAITAYRVVNGQADGIPGLVIERLGSVLILQLHEGGLELTLEAVRQVAARVHSRLGTRAVYRKTFVRDRADAPAAVAEAHRSPAPWIGEPVEPEQVVSEYGLRFMVRPYDGFSVGLFLEHRDHRRRIREWAAGRRVLNAFAYTSGFSVAAARGGADSTDNVDLSRRYLEWGKRNYAINGVDPGRDRFFCSDIFDFYKRAERQQRHYDLIILDPPTFSRSRRPKRAFVLQEQLGPLLTGAIGLLAPGGLVFLATHDRQISPSRLDEELTAAARSHHRPCAILERPPLPLDFAGDPDYAKSVIARVD